MDFRTKLLPVQLAHAQGCTISRDYVRASKLFASDLLAARP